MRTQMNQAAHGDSRANDMWSEAQPLLDDALGRLSSRDRDAILLRFFEGQTLREVGDTMGISEDAAKQRVFRAVEKLRNWFAGRGITVPSAAVVTWLSSAVKPTPSHVVSAIASATLPKPQLVAWSWLTSKAAAVGAVMVLSVAAAAGIAALADGRASGNAPSSPAAQNVEQAAPSTQSVVATMGQSTPVDTLRKLSAAIRANDYPEIDACLTDDGTNPKIAALLRSAAHMNAASCRLSRACSAAFGEQMRLTNFGFDLFPSLHGGFEILIDKSLEADHGEPTVKIDGNTAQIRLNIPREMMIGGAMRGQSRWSGATITLKQVDGVWKMDTDRTVTISVQFSAKRNGDALAIQRELVDLIVEKLNDVAGQIESGQIDTAGDVSRMVERAASQAFQACGVQNMSIAVQPAAGG